MELDIYQVDAFASEVFKGNPAAIVPLKEWLPTHVLQAIAVENNLSETAYFVPHEDGVAGHFHLRWFTPEAEVDLCGHATLASAFTLYEFLGETANALTFETRSGPLTVARDGQWLSMDFPSWTPAKVAKSDEEAFLLTTALQTNVSEVWAHDYYGVALVENEAAVRGIEYSGDLANALTQLPYWGLIVTAKGDSEFEFVSRFFAPEKGVTEDPVTGSAHCVLTPFWADRLGKTEMLAFQASDRGGMVKCELKGPRVILKGRAVPYLRGQISVPLAG